MPTHIQDHTSGVFRPRWLPTGSSDHRLASLIASLSPWGYWPLTDASGSTEAVDLSGNSRNLTTVSGTVFGSTALVSGSGTSADFSPASQSSADYVQDVYTLSAAAATAFGGNNQPVSVFCVARFDDISTFNRTLFHCGDFANSNRQGFELHLFSPDGKIYWQHYDTDYRFVGSAAISADTTYTVLGVRKADGTIAVYLNGQLSGSAATAGGSIQVSNSANYITIGALQGGNSDANRVNGLDGRIQHVAVFASDISASAEALHIASGLG